MTLTDIREVSLTIGAVGVAVGTLVGGGAFTYRLIQWLGTMVERAKKVTALVAEFPVLVLQMESISTVLTNLVDRFEEHSSASLAKEVLANDERILQVEERERVAQREAARARGTP